MRALVQRVTSARVVVEGDVVGELPAGGQGLLVLVGVTHDDGPEQVATVVRKVADLRVLDAERSAVDAGAPVLVVSQFTLYADTRKGRRPSWSAAAPGQVAEPLVEAVVEGLRERGLHVETGRFGAHMQVELVNDGPMTLLLEA
ncbi:D-aminoacyl-tRNA deacylase [Angustibacter aerolatus]